MRACGVVDCDEVHHARDLCHRHYNASKQRRDLLSTGAVKIPPCPPTPCREWRGSVDSDGYGMKRFNGKKRGVHRWVYSRVNGGFRGIIGKKVLHLCDNPKCYRYDHLWAGTQTTNMVDRHAKGRDARGSQHPRATLTEAQVRDLRRAFEQEPPVTITTLARRFGISPRAASYIVHRQTWAWLD